MTARPVAIVTAAGRGLGEACARELAQRGYALALMSPSGSSVRLARSMGAIGLDGSITEPADLARLVEATLERHGRIDAVVNNTGRYRALYEQIGAGGQAEVTGPRLGFDPDYAAPLLEMPDLAWHGALDFLVLHAVRMARLVTGTMVRQGQGAIVNISGLESAQLRLVYPLGPARLALAGFTKLYADRYARHGVRMNSVLPGFLENVVPDEGLVRAIPMGRFGTLTEIARTVTFLLSDDAGYITGQSILADGGVNRAL
ncbi:MAG: SDR family oxidoreductase [Alphaproteobacteria bacterium]